MAQKSYPHEDDSQVRGERGKTKEAVTLCMFYKRGGDFVYVLRWRRPVLLWEARLARCGLWSLDMT